MTVKVYSVPRPLACRHSSLAAKQCGQRSRTGKLQRSQPEQCCSISLPSRAPLKNGALISSGTGTGFVAVCDIGIVPLWQKTLTAAARPDNVRRLPVETRMALCSCRGTERQEIQGKHQ